MVHSVSGGILRVKPVKHPRIFPLPREIINPNIYFWVLQLMLWHFSFYRLFISGFIARIQTADGGGADETYGNLYQTKKVIRRK